MKDHRWRTYNGEDVSLSTISHQHLSNVYWFYIIYHGKLGSMTEIAKRFLYERFKGKILKYRPKWEFKSELFLLEEKGLLKWNKLKTRARIIYEGKIIGYLESPQYIRDRKLTKIISE